MAALIYILPEPRDGGARVTCAVCRDIVLPHEAVYELKGSHPVRYFCTICTGELAGKALDAPGPQTRPAGGVDPDYEAMRADIGSGS